jgi:hypothetical protein
MTTRFKGAVLAALCFLLAGRARAGSEADGVPRGADACVDAYESAQERRMQGALMSAREQTQICAAAACPAFIRDDCAAWHGELDAEVPSVAFEVTTGGARLTDVRVTEGEAVLVERLDGPALELEPGSHTFRFEAAGTQPLTLTVVATRGQKHQRVTVELMPLAPSPPSLPDAKPKAAEGTKSPWPWVLVGTGVAGVTAFTLLASSGMSEEAKLERTCAPACGEEALQAVKTKYVVADISLAVGIGGLVAGGYLLLSGGEPEPASATTFPVRVVVGPRGGTASFSGDF